MALALNNLQRLIKKLKKLNQTVIQPLFTFWQEVYLGQNEEKKPKTVFVISNEKKNSFEGKSHSDKRRNKFDDMHPGPKQIFGRYKFVVVPQAIFSIEGKLLQCTDKASIMHSIEDGIDANESVDKAEDKLVGWGLWYINLCRLFNARSIFIQIICSVSSDSV